MSTKTTATIQQVFRAPLFTFWTNQYVRLFVPGLETGAPHRLLLDGVKHDFQYMRGASERGAEIMLRLDFAKGQTRKIEFAPAEKCSTDLTAVEISPHELSRVTIARCTPPKWLTTSETQLEFIDGFEGFPLESGIRCETPLQSRRLRRVNEGPLFADYEIRHEFAANCRYLIRFRCYRHDPWVEVAEHFSSGMDSELVLTLNPQGMFDSILSRDSFEGETQPVVEPLALERPGDVLCRIQMPMLADYFVPNNRGWFALFDSRNAARGMLGILGLYGAQWQYPVQNMMRVSVSGGRAVLRASLAGGKRYWLLYAGPVQRGFSVSAGARLRGSEQGSTPPSDGRFIFHRLHAEFNALRLDEHLDLTGAAIYDANCWDKPGIFGPDYRERARRNVATLRPLRAAAQRADNLTLQMLLNPRPQTQCALANDLFTRFEKWVRQFQGYREGKGDYTKSVIGFARRLRGLLIAYELLRKDGALTEEQIGRLHSYFVFAARRILDEGRWPHSKTWLHPDHPESTSDFYTYPGEHKSDRLVWTNCLPNFQSDQICALLHLSAIIPEYPEAAHWRRFALDDIERQLNAYCGKSGAWEESINYALYTFSYFVITFKVLKERCGINYFEDERGRRFAGWLVRFFGPFDKRFGAFSFPGVGNSRVPQQYVEVLLAYAGELATDDPLRADLMAVYQRMDAVLESVEHSPLLLAVADVPDCDYPLRPLSSEHMDELGVAMRHAHPSPRESYLFQKIGFWKDHYENDESSFNWYAKGVPFTMDYGTYTFDVMPAAAHNLVEIPDMDPFRRGFLANHLFTEMVDFTHCEVPVTLKLLWGRPRSFEEMDNTDGKVERMQTPYFYIGEPNPVGPKVWKTRLLLFVKPDYIVLCDRVFGEVPHRFNLHVTADVIRRDGALIRAPGRFDLDLLCHVQHPAAFDFQSGEFQPAPERYGRGQDNPHRQAFCRLYNRSDSLYRTVLFAQEKSRPVTIAPWGASGVHITTAQYEDYVFLGEEWLLEKTGAVQFAGRAGWMRRESSGQVRACVPDGEHIAAFGVTITGRGPWTYNLDGSGRVALCGGAPRAVGVQI